jgi:hypothetical protein
MKNRIQFLIVFLCIALLFFAVLIPNVHATTEYESCSAYDAWSVGGVNWAAQSFTTSTMHTVTSIYLYLGVYSGSPSGTITISIQTLSAGNPSGTDLTSGTIGANNPSGWYQISMYPEYTLSSSTQYAIVVRDPSDSYSNSPFWGDNIYNPYSGGIMFTSAVSGSSWLQHSGWDLSFQIWGNPVTFSIAAWTGAGGSIYPSGTVAVTYGQNQAFTITPSAGDQISNVLVDGSSVGAVSSYTFTNVQAMHTIYASFNRPFKFASLQVSPTQTSPGGTLTFSGNLLYVDSSSAAPDGDYNIQVLLSGMSVASDHTLVSGSWSTTAAAPGSAGSYTYTCTATSTPTPGTFSTVTVGYNLVITSTTGGSTNPAVGTYVEPSGTNVQITGTASGGYTFDHWLIDSSTLNYSNPFTINMGANHNVQAVFQLTTPPPSDTTPPTFGSITANTTGAGLPIHLSCPVSDNIAVAYYWFSWNNTGTWQNQTKVSVSGSSVTATLNSVWNGTIGNTVTVKVYANDTSASGNEAASGSFNFLLVDTIAPSFEQISTNATIAGTSCLFAGLAADNANVSGWIRESNITGVTANTTWAPFTVFHNSTAAWCNGTLALPPVVGNTVQWRLLVNDSANNWAATELQNLTLTSPPPGSFAALTFHVTVGGLLYVNGGLVADNSTLNCTMGATLSLATVALAGYSFNVILWTNGSSASSPASLTVTAADSVYVYFTALPGGTVSSGGPTSPGSPQAAVGNSYVTVSQGGSEDFQITVSWQGGGTLTVTSVSAIKWISLSDTLPKNGSSGTLTVTLRCAPELNATLGQTPILLSVGIQSTSGGVSLVPGTVYVTVTAGGVQMSMLEIVMIVIMTLISFGVLVYGFVVKH